MLYVVEGTFSTRYNVSIIVEAWEKLVNTFLSFSAVLQSYYSISLTSFCVMLSINTPIHNGCSLSLYPQFSINACFQFQNHQISCHLQYKGRSIYNNHVSVICCTLRQLLIFQHSWYKIVTHFEKLVKIMLFLMIYNETCQVENLYTVYFLI